MGIVRFLCSLWEVPDNFPLQPSKVVVGMSMPQMRSGQPGKLLNRVVESVAYNLRPYPAEIAIFSNRWPVDDSGKSLAELEKERAIFYGAKEDQIVIPQNPRDPKIRNTYEEAVFTINWLVISASNKQYKSLHIVANHLHMRRALATFRKVAKNSEVVLTWQSVCGEEDYGPGYSQERYRHPLFFLGYEILAYSYSIVKGYL